jgi:hypothetical protein
VRILAAAAFLLAANAVCADDRRAQVNYMLHCQGCHLPDTEGFPGKVPPMKNFVGYFLHSEEGREFLIRVPGVAQSALDDDEISELMNWLIQTHSAEQLPGDFRPFTSDEVARLRRNPVRDPDNIRGDILGRIAQQLPQLAAELDNDK